MIPTWRPGEEDFKLMGAEPIIPSASYKLNRWYSYPHFMGGKLRQTPRGAQIVRRSALNSRPSRALHLRPPLQFGSFSSLVRSSDGETEADSGPPQVSEAGFAPTPADTPSQLSLGSEDLELGLRDEEPERDLRGSLRALWRTRFPSGFEVNRLELIHGQKHPGAGSAPPTAGCRPPPPHGMFWTRERSPHVESCGSRAKGKGPRALSAPNTSMGGRGSREAEERRETSLATFVPKGRGHRWGDPPREAGGTRPRGGGAPTPVSLTGSESGPSGPLPLFRHFPTPGLQLKPSLSPPGRLEVGGRGGAGELEK
ncbi:uncharacterized protein LOC141554021 [Sminthopsis crassicaudata]|uniref:uncharacterized protein LOC141554021 n=1 Tax=Sminthopsis crassicaudata TaxID=9301 RepID=UPI003D694BDA